MRRADVKRRCTERLHARRLGGQAASPAPPPVERAGGGGSAVRAAEAEARRRTNGVAPRDAAATASRLEHLLWAGGVEQAEQRRACREALAAQGVTPVELQARLEALRDVCGDRAAKAATRHAAEKGRLPVAAAVAAARLAAIKRRCPELDAAAAAARLPSLLSVPLPPGSPCTPDAAAAAALPALLLVPDVQSLGAGAAFDFAALCAAAGVAPDDVLAAPLPDEALLAALRRRGLAADDTDETDGPGLSRDP